MCELFERRCVVLNKTQPSGERSSSDTQRDASLPGGQTLPMTAISAEAPGTTNPIPVVEAQVDPHQPQTRIVPEQLTGRFGRMARQAEDWLMPRERPADDDHDSRIVLLTIKLLTIIGVTVVGQIMTSMGWLRAELSLLNPGVLTLLVLVPLALFMLRVHQQLWGETGSGRNRMNIQTVATVCILSMIMIFMPLVSYVFDQNHGLLDMLVPKNELTTKTIFLWIHGNEYFSVTVLPLPVHVFIWAIAGLALGGYIARMLTKSDFVAGDRRVIRKANACLCSIGLLAGAVSGFLLFFVWSAAPAQPGMADSVIVSCTWALLGGCIVPKMEVKPRNEWSLDPTYQVTWNNISSTVSIRKWFWERAWPHTSKQSVHYLANIAIWFFFFYFFTMQSVRVYAEISQRGFAT